MTYLVTIFCGLACARRVVGANVVGVMADTATLDKPLAISGPIETVERERVLYIAEDPDDGPFKMYDGDGGWVERPAITRKFLKEVAANSDPQDGKIVANGETDFQPQLAIGHEDDKRFLHAANLPSAGNVQRVKFDDESGELRIRARMPKQIAELQDAGVFPKVSARFYENYPGVDGAALAHVAMLGTQPEVKKNLGPWSPVLYSDNAEGSAARVKAKKAGLTMFDFSEGSMVIDFAEALSVETLRERVRETMLANAESSLENVAGFMETDEATNQEAVRFMAGETDEIGDDARKALMRFAGIPTMAVPTIEPVETEDEGEDEDEEPAEPETEPEETDMSERAKTKKKGKAKPAAEETITVSARDFAELQSSVHDLKFIVGKQKQRNKARDTEQASLRAQLNEQTRAARGSRILDFAERMHSEGRYPGRGRKQALIAYLETLGSEGMRVRDFAEGESTDSLERAMEFIEKASPPAVDTSGRIISASGVDEGAMDFAELDTELTDYRRYVGDAKAEGRPTDLTFHTFAEAQGHDPETVESYCREKKLKHPAILEGNVPPE